MVKSFENNYPRTQAVLDRLRSAERKAEMLRDRKNLLRMLTTDTSAHLTWTPNSSSSDQQKIQTALAEIDELDSKITAAEEALQAIRLDTAAMFCGISHPYSRKVLLMYFFDHKTWRTIARELNYGIKAIHRFRRKGLEEMETILKSKEEESQHE